MRVFGALAAGLGLLGLAAPAGAELPVIAVFHLENDGASLEARELERLTDYLSAELAATRRFQVVPKSQLKAALVAKKKESYEACYSDACQIEIGNELAAQQTLASRVQRFDQQCVVSLTLFDLRKATSVGGAVQKGGCRLGDIQRLVAAAVAALIGPVPPSLGAAKDAAKDEGPVRPARSAGDEPAKGGDPLAGLLGREGSRGPSTAAIRAVIQRNAGALRACAGKGSEAKTRVSIQLTIAPSGSVTAASLKPPGAGAAEGCLLRTARRMVFPSFEGAPVTVSLPVALGE